MKFRIPVRVGVLGGAKMRRLGWRSLAVAVGLAGATQASAGPPAATVGGNSQTHQDSFQIDILHGPGTVTSTAPGLASASSSATASLGGTGDFAGHPGASLHSSMSWAGGVGATASTSSVAVLDYFFEISGPAGKAALLYDASASFSTSQLYRGEDYGVSFDVQVAPQGLSSFADVIGFVGSATGIGHDPYVPDPLLGSSYIVANANPNGPHSLTANAADCPFNGCSQSMHLSGSALFTTNIVYEVSISAGTNIGISGPAESGSATVDETVDPIFMIDPNGPDAGLYTLAFSDGVIADQGFPASVPEPATWALLLLGAGGVGARLRWARSRGAAAAAA